MTALWMIGYILIRLLFTNVPFPRGCWLGKTLLISIGVGIWEALNDQNDNLTLPIITYVITRYFIQY